jgi:hypothetical protein
MTRRPGAISTDCALLWGGTFGHKLLGFDAELGIIGDNSEIGKIFLLFGFIDCPVIRLEPSPR